MAFLYFGQRRFSSAAARRVIKQTITADKLNQLNEKLLQKLNKTEEASEIAEYANPKNDIQRKRVTPDELSVQFKHNPERIGMRTSKYYVLIFRLGPL